MKYNLKTNCTAVEKVAPHAGVWIEIRETLKYVWVHNVAPHAGVWIEIFIDSCENVTSDRRSPRGSVD